MLITTRVNLFRSLLRREERKAKQNPSPWFVRNRLKSKNKLLHSQVLIAPRTSSPRPRQRLRISFPSCVLNPVTVLFVDMNHQRPLRPKLTVSPTQKEDSDLSETVSGPLHVVVNFSIPFSVCQNKNPFPFRRCARNNV